jgi:hypothetical protein
MLHNFQESTAAIACLQYAGAYCYTPHALFLYQLYGFVSSPRPQQVKHLECADGQYLDTSGFSKRT